MKRSIYVETSVISYLTGRAVRDVAIAGRQKSTRAFWRLLSADLAPYVSALVLKEVAKGNSEAARKRLQAVESFPVLRTVREAEQLAQAITASRGVPPEFPEDALHIAIAATSAMDFIVTWNFTHMNNPYTKLRIRRTVEYAGYRCPEIVSPDAFLGEER